MYILLVVLFLILSAGALSAKDYCAQYKRYASGMSASQLHSAANKAGYKVTPGQIRAFIRKCKGRK